MQVCWWVFKHTGTNTLSWVSFQGGEALLQVLSAILGKAGQLSSMARVMQEGRLNGLKVPYSLDILESVKWGQYTPCLSP